MSFPESCFFKIYDVQILPILLYGSEIWGHQPFIVLEKAHLFACKRILNVSLNTPNKMVYGDLGRYPLHVTSKVRCLKYWLRLVSMSDDRLPRKTYNMLLHVQENGVQNWAFSIKELLCRNGFGLAWLQQGVGCVKSFLHEFSQRLKDCYIQEWHASISSSERTELYSSFKSYFQPERYIDVCQLRCFREAYIKFRFGVSPIAMHKFRYRKNVTPKDLVCAMCKLEIEDEAHVLFVCKAYKELRQNMPLLRDVQRRCEDPVEGIFKDDSEDTIRQLHVSYFLYKVFCLMKAQ